MAHWHKQLLRHIRCIRVQVFFAYFLVLSLSFLVLGTSVALVTRHLLIDQIGDSRLELLHQISERANTVKTSASTLCWLYRYELSQDAPQDIQQTLDDQRQRFQTVFDSIGMPHDVALLSRQEAFSAVSTGKLPAYLEDQLWYRRLRQKLLNQPPGTVCFSSSFPDENRQHYQFAAALLLEGDPPQMLLVSMDEQVLERIYASSLGSDGNIYIYDEDGFIVSHSNKKIVG
ncbi:MAG: cache domain-containing protein, partial [Plesiomonas sp.]|nr:cache domain-containing protein [Plesiomonas sp.]